jgi:hypothetical protein
VTELEKRGDRAPVPAEWTYAEAPESREVVRLRERYGHFVGGRWLEPSESYTTIDPSTEEPLAQVGQATGEEIAAAVGAARDAFENGWSGLPAPERAKYLFRIARILQERAREFAVLESLNGGKPIKESRDVDLPLAAAHFFYYAGWADKLEYAFPNRRPRPVGVAGQIIPWNFPLLMLAWKIAPALACGNTVVLKPAETTPLSALLFCDVLRQAELPPGVVNIVTGDGRTGSALVRAEGIDKIAFTGSTEVGKAIQRELAGTGRKLTLELGGKAANVVFDDAALDQAVEGIVNGIYFNQGHVCCAGSRLLVQESIYEPLIAAAGQEHRRRRDQLEAAAREDRRARRGRPGGGRRGLPAALPPAGEGLLVRADRFHQRRAELPHRAGGDLRPRPLRPHLPHPRRGRREGEQHAVRPVRRRLDGEGVADPLDGPAPARRRRLGEHVQPLRPELTVRRLPRVRVRPRGRTPRARAVPAARGRGDVRGMTRIAILAAVAASAVAVASAAVGADAGNRFRCTVSRTTGHPVPGRPSFNVGNARIAVDLPSGATFVAVPETEPGGAFVQQDGWIRAKVGWWRARGTLRVGGRRLDAHAPPLRADVGPPSSTPSGLVFVPSLLYFPTIGCWRITATAGGARLAAVVRVVAK